MTVREPLYLLLEGRGERALGMQDYYSHHSPSFPTPL